MAAPQARAPQCPLHTQLHGPCLGPHLEDKSKWSSNQLSRPCFIQPQTPTGPVCPEHSSEPVPPSQKQQGALGYHNHKPCPHNPRSHCLPVTQPNRTIPMCVFSHSVDTCSVNAFRSPRPLGLGSQQGTEQGKESCPQRRQR